MKHSRRTFFKQGLAGALLLGTSTIARAALPDPVKPKAPKAVNPFHLGMAGYTFVNFVFRYDVEDVGTIRYPLSLHQGFPFAVE